MDAELLRHLPSTFYRVAVKCLIFNDAGELLVLRTNVDDIEIPGGGWEHGETIEECAERELQEELGVGAKTVTPVETILQGKSDRGWSVLRVVVRVELASTDFSFGDEEVVDAFYVNQTDFASLNFGPSDAAFTAAAKLIWPEH